VYRSSLGFKYWNYFVWGVERLQIIDLHFTPFRCTILWWILECENVGFIANMLMFERRRLCVVGEMGKLNWVDYISIYMYLKNSVQNFRNPLPINLFGGWHQCGDDGHPSVLLHSMKTTVNFMRRLTGINVLYVAYLKHEHCSQQYSDRHVFVSINWYRQHAVF